MGIRRGVVGVVCAALLGLGAIGAPAPAQAAPTLPTGFSMVPVVASGLLRPTIMATAPDGRIFVSLGGGRIVIIKNGALLRTPFLDISPVVDSQGDRGMNGLAFDPDFPTSPWVYLYYTVKTPQPHNRVSRFLANGDVVVPGSEQVLIDLPNLGAAVLHNGGSINFGPDRKLYISVGDNVRPDSAQRLDTTLGKMLRINADGTIPTDNPFFGVTTGQNRAIWALGLRNPYTWAFSNSGRMFINDVGADTWEEVNEGTAGANFGWPLVAGAAGNPSYTDPVWAYRHGTGPDEGCATIGGAFYEPPTPSYPAQYVGKYFSSDYCAGWIKTVDPTNGYAVQTFATGLANVVSLTRGPGGDLYVMTRADEPRASATLSKIVYAPEEAPRIVSQPADLVVAPGATATFSVLAAGTGPLTYQWFRDRRRIPGATDAAYTTGPVSDADSGARLRVKVTNALGSRFSRDALLTVSPNQPPVPAFVLPAAGAAYSGGQTVAFSATATDPEDGVLPPSAFSWDIVFHHDMHTHAFITPGAGITSGSFTVPVRDFEPAANVWFRIHLRVTDSRGLTTEITRDVLPRTTEVSVATSPTRLNLHLDGTAIPAPVTFTGVSGYEREVGAPAEQLRDGRRWVFDGWTDLGAASHTIAPSPVANSLTAVYRRADGSVGNGTGLRGNWFPNADFSGTPVVRTDRYVAFDFARGIGAPAPVPDARRFSARWTGSVIAQFSGPTTFVVRADGGVRLWIDGALVIDRATGTTLSEYQSPPLSMTAGSQRSIRLELIDGTGRPGQVRLMWSSPSIARSIVPSTQLLAT